MQGYQMCKRELDRWKLFKKMEVAAALNWARLLGEQHGQIRIILVESVSQDPAWGCMGYQVPCRIRLYQSGRIRLVWSQCEGCSGHHGPFSWLYPPLPFYLSISVQFWPYVGSLTSKLPSTRLFCKMRIQSGFAWPFISAFRTSYCHPRMWRIGVALNYFSPPRGQNTKHRKHRKTCKPEGHEGRIEALAARPAYLLTLLKKFDSDMSHQASIRRECSAVCCSDFCSTCIAYIASLLHHVASYYIVVIQCYIMLYTLLIIITYIYIL